MTYSDNIEPHRQAFTDKVKSQHLASLSNLLGDDVTPSEFIDKWQKVELNEQQAAKEHFIDLCNLFNHPTPAAGDPTGESYCFEKGALKSTGTPGFADVWKRGYFAWEYKKKKKNLGEALGQLSKYVWNLESPPIHVACDTNLIRVVTAFNNQPSKTFDIKLEDLNKHESRAIIEAVLFDPERLRGHKTRAMLTEEAASLFGTISDNLNKSHSSRDDVAHFVNQLVFCYFADAVKLLPEGLLGKIVKRAEKNQSKSKGYLDKLFEAMQKGGEYDLTDISHFNGGLFDDRRSLELTSADLKVLVSALELEWGEIDPTIFGTLFERYLDPDKRAQIGAHYTDEGKIFKVIDPVVTRPLNQEWTTRKARISDLLSGKIQPPLKKPGSKTKKTPIQAAEDERGAMLDRLSSLKILDPACGSGNFLYLALQAVKDLELRVITECEELGLGIQIPLVGPEILYGIEVNKFAAELARTTIWIGHIQWGIRNSFYEKPSPILKKLDNIQRMDAIIDDNGQPAKWPDAEFIIGNPPYLGDRWLNQELGEDYTSRLRAAYSNMPASSNLVCYWFEKTARAIASGKTERAGLVATSTIRNPNTRFILDRMNEVSELFEAWSNIVWIEGHGKAADKAALRVAITCYKSYSDNTIEDPKLDGLAVEVIHTDLSARSVDLTKAQRLAGNKNIAFQGIIPWGKGFVVPGPQAREMLAEAENVNGKKNSEVIFPYRNAIDLSRRSKDRWLIDMGSRTEKESKKFDKPYKHILKMVKPQRVKTGNAKAIDSWWRLWNPRPAMRSKFQGLNRYIATPRVSEHRFFVWLPVTVLPDSRVVGIARDDDATMGFLSSRVHKLWSMAKVALHGVGDDPTYNTREIFETFPFPIGFDLGSNKITDKKFLAVGELSKALTDERDKWLNPSDLVKIVPEIDTSFPDQVLPKDTKSAKHLRERTLTKFYNDPPAWLEDYQSDLDQAVIAAYGWDDDITDKDVLEKLLEMNLSMKHTSADDVGETDEEEEIYEGE